VLPALAVPVLETGMEEAVTLAESMDSRGHGHGRRTRYRPDRWNLRSIAVVTASVGAAAVFLATSFGGGDALHPSTAPLVWPETDPWLLATIGLLIVPALLPRQEARTEMAPTTDRAVGEVP
jgi:energy-coupling factor transport system permease protein